MAVSKSRNFQDAFITTVVDPGFQVVRTYAIDPDSVLRFEIVATCRQQDGNNRGTFRRLGLFYRPATTPVSIQGQTWQSLETIRSHSTMEIGFIMNSNSVSITFRNPIATPCKWIAKVYLQVLK